MAGTGSAPARVARRPARVGIIGTGAMGAGIAAAACRAGSPVTMVDVSVEAVTRGHERVVATLDRGVERGRMSSADAATAKARLSASSRLDALAGSDLIIEAVPEDPELKAVVLDRAGAAASGAVLASNTSSIPIESLATRISEPARLVGMHFFNPVHATRLVELVATPATAAAAIETARRVGEGMGKIVLVVPDGPGFLVNRCARPFYLEALRLLEDGVAEPAQVDRICRRAGGFPIGPFELMDLIGIDVSLAVTESMWEQSGREPRWRPSGWQVDLVERGRLGRKSGAGFYRYATEPEDRGGARIPSRGGGDGRLVAIGGDGPVAMALRARARECGFRLCDWEAAEATAAWLGVDAEPARHLELREEMLSVARTRLCGSSDLAGSGDRGACGFHLIGPLPEGADLVELTRTGSTNPGASSRAAEFFAAIGFEPETVGDAPGLVLGRIVAQLVNEAWFAVDEGVASPEDVDTATQLGLNYPRGTVAWGAAAGIPHVRAVLAALQAGRDGERYVMAPSLRVREGSVA